MPGATSMSTIVISTSLRLWANYVVLYHTGNNDITATGIVSMPILGIMILREEHLILQHYRIRWSCGRLIMKGWHETNAAITRRRGLTDWIRSIRSRIQNTQPGGTRRQGLTFTGVSFFSYPRQDKKRGHTIFVHCCDGRTGYGVVASKERGQRPFKKRLSFIVVTVAPDMASKGRGQRPFKKRLSFIVVTVASDMAWRRRDEASFRSENGDVHFFIGISPISVTNREKQEQDVDYTQQ